MSRFLSRLLKSSLFLFLALSAGPAPVGRAAAAEPAAGPKNRYALLIGCTKYQNLPPQRELSGPANDVPRFAELLEKSFDFPEQNVTQLLGWPDDPARRATHDNIAAAFKDLVRKTNKGDQVVILLSGHGMMIPILDPTPAQKWKAHHLAFLPLDVQNWNGDSVVNALYDDDFNDWLGQMRARGASVLVVFDCCHAGSMSRGLGEERLRTVNPQELGVPDQAVEKAVKRARDEFANDPPKGERSRGGPELLPSGLGLSSCEKTGEGSVTAIYACQPFEETLELPLPDDAPRTAEHYFGLLSYTLCQVLNEQGHKLTYRELGQMLIARYKAERGSRGPTPFVDGDLDREVLGMTKWPGRSSIFIQRDDDRLMVSAGGLMGLTPGSILSVHPPTGDPRGPDTVLGYVRVTHTAPAQADVEPCAFKETPAADAAALPTRGVCRLEQRDFGDLRVKVATARPKEIDKTKKDWEKDAGHNARLEDAAAALKGLSPEVKDLVAVVADEAAAEWVLDEKNGQIVLRQGVGGAVSDDASRKEMEENDKTLKTLGQPVPRRSFGGYGGKLDEIKEGLERDLPRIFTWQTVWRVAGNLDGAAAADLEFKIVKATKTDDAPELPNGSLVTSGQKIELQLANNTTDDLWVALVMPGADFGIDVQPMSLKRGERRSVKAKIETKTFGREGVVVLAFPQLDNRIEPSFDFLKQEPLHQVGKGLNDRLIDLQKAPETPFGRLMKSAAGAKGTRGLILEAPTNPLVRSWSWTAVPSP